MLDLPRKLQYKLRYTIRQWHQRSQEWKDMVDTVKIRQPDKNSGRMANHYVCKNCNEAVRMDQINLEHIIPIEDQEYNTIDEYYALMVDLSNQEPWCKFCSKEKTAKEKTERAKKKKANKKQKVKK